MSGVGAAPGRLAPYRALFGARFRMLLQYRAAALGGLITQIVFGLILIMIYEAFYRSSTAAVQPMAFGAVASYVWLGQTLIMMLPWNVDEEMRAMMRSGAVGNELCRPVDLYAWWFARALAQRTAPVVLRAVPIVAFAALGLPRVGLDAWRLAGPASLAAGVGFGLAMLCGLALACAMSVLLYISWLWTVVAEGTLVIVSTVVSLCSGLLVPLPLFPAWARSVLRWLPFAGLLDQPAQIYSGQIPVAEVAVVLAREIGWTVVLVGLGRWLLGHGLRRVVVHGG
ncbi:MAG TPA: ABC-2 family transporter protein [Kofleriaceae bacterium]|nr:ABC-2 family transporter protein [Kofleriaceae bacterium]